MGTSAAGLLVNAGLHSNPNVSGRIITDASEFILDAGRYGVLRIPYRSILGATYGPTMPPRDQNAGQSHAKYPWSAGPHRAPFYYLEVRFRDDAGTPQVVFLGLSKDIERATLELLQQRTTRPVDFETVESCLRGRTREACGYGDLADLKGRTSVFVESSSAEEVLRTENYRRIVATIEKSGVPLKVVGGPDDADIILAFRHSGFRRPSCSSAPGYGPDRAVAEVYVAHASGPRVVMVFDEECRLWRRWLADTFAQAFTRAYKTANGIR
jgi:hypothetical protein